jgi:hypothetical protein
MAKEKEAERGERGIEFNGRRRKEGEYVGREPVGKQERERNGKGKREGEKERMGDKSGRRGKEGHHLKSNVSMAFQKELKHLS